MNNQLIFVDDSGDPGFKMGSSQYFVIACVVFDNEAEAALAAAIKTQKYESMDIRDATI